MIFRHMTDINRKQLKGPDEFVTFFGRLVSQIENNFRWILAAIIMGLLLIFGVIQWRGKVQEQGDVAFMEYFNLMREREEFISKDVNKGPHVKETDKKLERVKPAPDLTGWINQAEHLIRKFPKGLATKLTRLQLSEVYFQKQQWDKVLSTLSPIVESREEPVILELAMLNQAYALEEKGDFTPASDQFLKLKTRPSPFFSSEGFFGAARCQEKLGKPDEALKIYAEIEKKFPETPYSKKAHLYSQALHTSPASK